jgi:hypothetical protein
VSGFRDQARWQAGWCTTLGSPFTALICTLLVDRLPGEAPLGRLLDGWQGDAFADVLALRVAGGLHAMVRSGDAPALRSLYPPAPLPDADLLWAAMSPVLERPEMRAFVARSPQTNEVGRSGVLVPGLLEVAAATGLPLDLFELGASAGLNLLPDRYRVEMAGVVAGDPGSCLRISPRWEGRPPPEVPLRIAGRLGVDVAPLDLVRDADRMLAYLWPDQPERLARMEAAVALASADPPEVLAGDAAAFLDERLTLTEGRAAVVFHSIAFQYFPDTTKARIRARMATVGATATPERPLAWLRFEADDPAASTPPTLRLQLWPEGTDRLLAEAHPHGTSVRWLA